MAWTFLDLEDLHKRLLPHDEKIMQSDFSSHWKQIRRIVEEKPIPAPTKGSMMYLTDCARMICETYGF